MWPGLAPPYLDLFAWLEGRADKPVNLDPAPFRPVMLAHAIEDADFANLDAADFIAEWKWDGIRVQAVSGRDERGNMRGAALFAHRRRHHQELSGSAAVAASARRDRRRIAGAARRPRADLQRAAAAAEPQSRLAEADQGISDPSARLRSARRRRQRSAHAAVRRTPRAARSLRRKARRSADRPVADDRLRQLGRADRGARRSRRRRRRRRCRSGRRRDAEAPRRAVSAGPPEGPMVEMEARSAHHRRRADVCAARPRQALVLLFRLHVRGLDRGRDGEQLVPVGKAYFGFTDEELLQIDRFVRRNTTEKFGPVRHVVHEPDQGLVLEVAFEGLAALAAAQIRRRDAVSAHQPAALGQAAARGRPAGNAGADAEGRSAAAKLRQETRQTATAAIDAGRRVPHLRCTDYNAPADRARETIDAQRHQGIAGSQ